MVQTVVDVTEQKLQLKCKKELAKPLTPSQTTISWLSMPRNDSPQEVTKIKGSFPMCLSLITCVFSLSLLLEIHWRERPEGRVPWRISFNAIGEGGKERGYKERQFDKESKQQNRKCWLYLYYGRLFYRIVFYTLHIQRNTQINGPSNQKQK